MRLTLEIHVELNIMSDRIKAIRDEMMPFSNHSGLFDLVQNLHREELNAHKVRLEILLSETDIKEQSKNHY